MECKLLSFDLSDCDFLNQPWDSRMTVVETELNEWLKEGWKIQSTNVCRDWSQYIVTLVKEG